MTRTDVLAAVRTADPFDPAEGARWLESAGTADLLERILAASAEAADVHVHPADTTSGRRRAGQVVAAVALVAAGGTAAAYATGIVGGPAPESVKQHLAGLDDGMPADLRYNPDVIHARGVAATDAGALYLADTPGGGYCLEVVSDTARPRGASCVTASQLSARPLDVTAPIPDSDASVLLVGGRANDQRIAAIRATYPDGTSVDVPLGIDRSWLLEVAAANRQAALDRGLRITALDADRHVVVSRDVPPLRDDDRLGTAHDHEQPIVVGTVSDGHNLRLVLAITGRVNLGGDVQLSLHYPDGTTTPVTVGADGAYRVTIPADLRGAFANAPGRLVATRAGDVVATAPVASIAWWRAHDG